MEKYPSKCGNCGKLEVRPALSDFTIEYLNIQLKGLEIPTCSFCGSQWINSEIDNKIQQTIKEQA